MEHKDNILDQYREKVQKKNNVQDNIDPLTLEALEHLIQSRRFTQYEHRCFTKDLIILLLLLLFGGSLISLYFIFLYSHPVWTIIALLFSVFTFYILTTHLYDRYLLWRIRPQLIDDDDDHFMALLNKLNHRSTQHYQRLHPFQHLHRFRWAPITGIALGCLAIATILIISFPLNNISNSKFLIADTQEVTCNQNCCDYNKYYQIVYSSLNSKSTNSQL